jgi:orotate phosphoribosyltransferase
MLTDPDAKSKLLGLLRKNSVFHGDFILASGAKSNCYVDCKLTTLDPEGAWLTGQVMHSLIKREAALRNLRIDSVGGLTMGADPIALAIGMWSFFSKDGPCLRTFVVRKTPKSHGQAKLIEGNFRGGDLAVIIDDVITRGDSTISAINAVEKEGGRVAFVAALVDRQEGGRQKIEQLGHPVVPVFERREVFESDPQARQPTHCVPA